MAAFAIEGAAIGVAGAAINDGDLGKGAYMGAGTGAVMGFLSSEQFQNWRQGDGFFTNEAVAEHNQRIARLAALLGDDLVAKIQVVREGKHLDIKISDFEGNSLRFGKFPHPGQDKHGHLRDLAYLLGKKVEGVWSAKMGGEPVSVYYVNNIQLSMFQSYVNNGPGAFSLSTNCTDWVVGALRSTGVYVPPHQYRTLGFADPSKFGKN